MAGASATRSLQRNGVTDPATEKGMISRCDELLRGRLMFYNNDEIGI